jgi:ABC-2 type transport system ATP-binding protein
VAVIAAGHIVAEGTPESIGGRDVGAALVSFRVPSGVTAGELPLPSGAQADNGRVSFSTATPTRDLAALLGWASERDLELDGLTVSRPTLEDVYLDLTDGGHR